MATFRPERLDFLPGYAIIPEKEAIVVIREKIIAWLRDEQKKLAPMSPKKKWEYIWNYYKWWILGAVLLVGIVITGISDAQYQKKQVLVSGMFINTATNAEGYAYVKEDYWTYAGADPDTRVELTEARSVRFELEQPTEMDVNLIMSVDTMIAAGDLDYIIGDASAVKFYAQRESLLDLTEIFSEAQLSQWNVMATDAGVMAIELTDSKLQQQFGLYTQPSYIMILVNTSRREQCVDFIQYLFQK